MKSSGTGHSITFSPAIQFLKAKPIMVLNKEKKLNINNAFTYKIKQIMLKLRKN